jgi:hypothetical protein
MFISAVELFILPLKFKIDHHREKLYGPKDYMKLLEME